MKGSNNPQPFSKYLSVTYVLITTRSLCNPKINKTLTALKELTRLVFLPESLTGGFHYLWILVPPKEKK